MKNFVFMNDSLIQDYLVANKEHLKLSCSSLETTKNSLLNKHPEAFTDFIKEQYHNMIRNIIVNEVTKALAIPAEDVILVLDSINVEEYLK